MAFSTQHDVIKIAFLNDRLEPVCVAKTGVKLKSYLSSTDSRAWSMNRGKQAHFVADLVACGNYAVDSYESDVDAFGPTGLKPTGKEVGRGSPRSTPHGSTSPRDTSSGGTSPQKVSSNLSLVEYMSSRDTPKFLDQSKGSTQRSGKSSGADVVTLGPEKDSLLELARDTVPDVNDILSEKPKEEKEMENEKLKESSTKGSSVKKSSTKGSSVKEPSALEEKISELQEEGKLSEEEAKSLSQMSKFIDCRESRCQALEAENSYLKHLVEKLQDRANVKSIPSEEETSEDVEYLKKLVKDLRDEVGILRLQEQENERIKGDYDDLKNKYNSLSADQKQKTLNVDASAVDLIVKERDDLRDELAGLIGIESKIDDLKKKANEADRLQKELDDLKKKCANLEKGSQEASKVIDKAVKESGNAVKEKDCYKNKCADLESQLREMEDLREQLAQMCKALQNAQCKLQQMKHLEQELLNTKKRLRRSESALIDYEGQMQQLLEKINRFIKNECPELFLA